MIKEGIDDVVAAISTPNGSGGIGIVRMSGEGAVEIADVVFKSKNGSRLVNKKSHTLTLGNFVNPANGRIVDEVLVGVMRSPSSYTTEDVVEFNCHGGMLAVKEILEILLCNGARLAEPGEFTKRAFLNGRLDLAQAEAVIDLINAKTKIALETAANQLNGRLTMEVTSMRNEILDMIAGIEAAIDYPEYDVEAESRALLLEKANNIDASIKNLLKNADRGKILREGLETVIIGKPNVGKSSLLNWFLDEERAIVTDIAGTTRDTVEEYFNLDGIPIKIVDTAGIRQTDDGVEKIGVEKAKVYAAKADLILLVLDLSRPLSDEDFDVIKLSKNKNTIVLLNKTDLTKIADISDIDVPKENIVTISVKKNIGFDALAQKIKEMFFGCAQINDDMAILGNTRHKSALFNAGESLKHAIYAIESQMPEDFISMDLQEVNRYLGEITGDTIDEEIIDRIFTRFCLGK